MVEDKDENPQEDLLVVHCLGSILAYPINVKVGVRKQNHTLTRHVIRIANFNNSRRWTAAIFEDGFLSISTANHPILVNFGGMYTRILMKIFHLEHMADRSHSEFSAISAPYCPINAKFGVRKQTYTQRHLRELNDRF